MIAIAERSIPLYTPCSESIIRLMQVRGASAPARVVSIVNADRQVAALNPPEGHGVFPQFCPHSTLVATPETPMTGATPNPPGILSGYYGRPLHALPRGGVETMFRSEPFPR